ncbi:Fe-S cluster assembly protein SufD [Candidatus Liberibacter sp.]|uniref:Fe-S cluster assembly protein SufD n=1 Tax=Candidatus Liberibacter sp. TaxID=34022 RepID=UPI0015F53135|nr:Fe-S cluster assembly protein SufD [Candidatus Liberibacter sp.]MBA5723861.1 Fe-S cluster assembly protein SufD [Candidatus Liberibacter sp.]
MENFTEAENVLLQICEKVCRDSSPNQFIAAFRERLLHNFRVQGLLPTRRVESWHYTDLKRILKTFPTQEETKNPFEYDYKCLVGNNSIRLRIGQEKDLACQARGIEVRPFSHLLNNGEEKSICLEPLDKHDAISHINAILVRDGYEVNIPEGCKLDSPIELQSVQCGGNMHLRYPIKFGAGSKTTIIERYIAHTDSPSLVTSISDVKICSGAEVIWIIVQEQGFADTHLGQLRVSLEKDSSLKVFVVNAGRGVVRREISVDVEGQGSEFILRGINLLKDLTHNDLSMSLRHKVEDTLSTAVVRNVVLNKANGVFQGEICVASDAQRTNASMASNTLLLSDKGSFSTKPELEIFADDVQCGHGATVSDINHGHLYYLMARGIPENQARVMLVGGFVVEILRDLEDKELQESLERVVFSWLNNSFHGLAKI